MNQTGTNDGSIAWDFSVANSLTQYLAEGETVTVTYTITVTDDSGSGNNTATQEVTVVITGTNDAPIFTGGPDTSSLTETDAGLSDTGTLTVSDEDTTDNVTAAVDSVAVSGTGAVPGSLDNATLQDFLTVAPTAIVDATENTGTLTWSFDSGTEAFDFLATGETLVLTYTVSATDDAGTPLSDTETITVTITGTNDGPQATNLNAAENYTEDTPLNLVDIVISDVDDSDLTVTLTLSDVAAGTLNTGTSGAVTSTFASGVWTASGAIADVNNLLAALTFTPASNFDSDFTIATSVDDGEAPAVTGVKNFTATAVNDAPVITDGPDTSSLIETNSGLTDSGTLTVSDADETDTVTASVDSVVVTGTGSSSVPAGLNNAAIKDFLTVNPTEILDDTQTSATLTWDFDSGTEAFDFLADGETLVLTYTVKVTDDAGTPLSDTETVTVTITGTNDAPTVTSVDVTGTVTEDASTPNLTDSGSVTFEELDETDVITSSVVLSNTATFNSATVSTELATALSSALSLTQTGTNDGTIVWDFSVANSVTQYLADGEVIIANYTITVSDDSGTGNNSATQLVNVVITGTNDTPTITVVDVDGAVTEDASTPNLTDNGSEHVRRIDDNDSVTSSVAIKSTATTGPDVPAGLASALNSALSLTQIGSNDGTIDWDFEVANSLTQYLAAGETVTVTYTITVSDDSGTGTDSTTQDVTVVITGTNDTPTITVVDVDGAVTEDASTPDLTDSGSINFADVDDTDVISSSVAITNTTTTGPAIPTELTTALDSALSLNQTGTNDGSIAWDFSVANSLTQYLAEGETVTVTYTITVTDDSGSGNNTATQEVTVVITGTNDAPIFTGGPDTSSLTETDAGLSDTGTLTVSDDDTTDNVTAAVDSVAVSGTGAVPGSLDNATLQDFLTVAPTAIIDGTENTGTLTWSFDSGTEAFDFLATGETLVLTYTVSATDDAGTPLSDTETITVTITGTNDGPQATNLNAAENYTEDTPLNLVDIVISDVDDSDLTVTLTLSDVAAGTLNTGTSGTVTSTFASGVWTASGAIADVNNLLAALTFTPAQAITTAISQLQPASMMVKLLQLPE